MTAKHNSINQFHSSRKSKFISILINQYQFDCRFKEISKDKQQCIDEFIELKIRQG